MNSNVLFLGIYIGGFIASFAQAILHTKGVLGGEPQGWKVISFSLVTSIIWPFSITAAFIMNAHYEDEKERVDKMLKEPPRLGVPLQPNFQDVAPAPVVPMLPDDADFDLFDAVEKASRDIQAVRLDQKECLLLITQLQGQVGALIEPKKRSESPATWTAGDQ